MDTWTAFLRSHTNHYTSAMSEPQRSSAGKSRENQEAQESPEVPSNLDWWKYFDLKQKQAEESDLRASPAITIAGSMAAPRQARSGGAESSASCSEGKQQKTVGFLRGSCFSFCPDLPRDGLCHGRVNQVHPVLLRSPLVMVSSP